MVQCIPIIHLGSSCEKVIASVQPLLNEADQLLLTCEFEAVLMLGQELLEHMVSPMSYVSKKNFGK